MNSMYESVCKIHILEWMFGAVYGMLMYLENLPVFTMNITRLNQATHIAM